MGKEYSFPGKQCKTHCVPKQNVSPMEKTTNDSETSTNQSKPFEDKLQELKEKYPVGTIVEYEVSDREPPRFSDLEKVPETIKAVVTGHDIHDQTITVDGEKLYPEKELGPRVNVSTNPPNYDKVENEELDYVTGKACKPEDILRKVKR